MTYIYTSKTNKYVFKTYIDTSKAYIEVSKAHSAKLQTYFPKKNGDIEG